jgi:hypothetical protein
MAIGQGIPVITDSQAAHFLIQALDEAGIRKKLRFL